MKRAGNLYAAICEPENLRLAYCKARRGKEDRPEVMKFAARVSDNLAGLRQDLLNESVAVGHYRYFTICDPKQRTICAASFYERVLHHAVMNVCDPVFERYQIFDSYATRRDKGTFAALERAGTFTRTNDWFLKLDVRKYFDSINHEMLKSLLRRLFKDERLLRLFYRIIESYAVTPGRGVPIGNLTSQYFANHVLAVADHMIKETLRVRGYVRYMDDMVLWGQDKDRLRDWNKTVTLFIKDRLDLVLKPPCLNKTEQGLPFLGFRLFPDRMLLRPGSKQRYRKKMRQLYQYYDDGLIDQEKFGLRAQTLTAHVAHARSRGLRRAVLTDLGCLPGARTA